MGYIFYFIFLFFLFVISVQNTCIIYMSSYFYKDDMLHSLKDDQLASPFSNIGTLNSGDDT